MKLTKNGSNQLIALPLSHVRVRDVPTKECPACHRMREVTAMIHLWHCQEIVTSVCDVECLRWYAEAQCGLAVTRAWDKDDV